MKRLLLGILVAASMFTMNACSADDVDPEFRIRNDRPDKANVQIQTSGGNTININDVNLDQTTGYQTAPEGAIVATAVIQNESISPTVSFYAGKNAQYTIVVQTGTTPSLRVVRE